MIGLINGLLQAQSG